jgi:ATP-dependent phosphofructokinase / diphosphate-dependent phosphofructokinase
MVGLAFGALAVQLVARNEHARMVALKDGSAMVLPTPTCSLVFSIRLPSTRM